MFTGLIDRIGAVDRLEMRGNGARLSLDYEAWPETVVPGESIAVNGVCLTVADRDAGKLAFDVLRETLDRTNLGGLKRGARVNLERSLRPGWLTRCCRSRR